MINSPHDQELITMWIIWSMEMIILEFKKNQKQLVLLMAVFLQPIHEENNYLTFHNTSHHIWWFFLTDLTVWQLMQVSVSVVDHD